MGPRENRSRQFWKPSPVRAALLSARFQTTDLERVGKWAADDAEMVVWAVQEMWTDDHEQQYQMADTHRISDMRGPSLPQVCDVMSSALHRPPGSSSAARTHTTRVEALGSAYAARLVPPACLRARGRGDGTIDNARQRCFS